MTRPPLTRRRILDAAVALADRAGLGALTMRRLGAELGVEAMSLYKHVANKDEILDGIVEEVVGRIEIPQASEDWREATRRRAVSMREVLTRHSWAIGLLESRGSASPTTLRYVDAVLGNLRAAGFSVEDAGHAFWLIDSYVYGHVVQETSLVAGAAGDPPGAADLPHLAEAAAHASAFSVDGEFEFGLGLLLGALDDLSRPGS